MKDKNKMAVLTEKLDALLHIRLNKPEKLNALDDEVKASLKEALLQGRDDDSVRAILISGEGRAFSAGGDINILRKVKNAVEGRRRIQVLQEIIEIIVKMEKPIIAAVQGYAVGAGCNLALSCDVVFATPSTKFSEIFTNIGLIPDGGGLYLLPRLIGLSRAKDLVFTARMVSGEEAERIGIANYLVSEDRLIEESKRYSIELSKRPTIALGFAKRILNNSFQLDMQSLFEYEASLQGICLKTEDFKEGAEAFVEKRKPVFVGK